MVARLIRKWFSLRDDLSLSFYLLDFLFRKIFRQNAGTSWPVHHTATIRCPERIGRGKSVFPGDSPNVYINAVNGVTIGDYTNIGPNVSIVSSNHDFIDNSQFVPAKPILIGRFCWIGSHACILPEVKLGDFTIVGAGAIVTKNFEEGYCVIVGNPARIIKKLDQTSCRSFAESKKK